MILDKNEGVSGTTIREIAILKELNHPNIIKMHNIIHFGNSMFIIFDLQQMDVKKFIELH